MESQARIFERFEQVNNALNRRHQGSGLGLAICKDIAALLGGTMTLSSELGKGSSFTFTCPFPATAGETAQTSRLSLLAVDDNELNRLLIARLLESAGHQVTSCASGAAALEVLASGATFDAVLMDIQMPEMDGLETTRHIRALHGPAAGLPVIAVTANVGDEFRIHYLREGMDGYVAKPVDRGLLIREINRVLATRL